ncbi:baculoviral IAP repeat-containing protein 3-like isoform X2 [Ruditapes philippinarum]|uniref:baculoviral IAP repeat-containing protein 3-like isoform X2 n=1 Tax=Ruditapes philippinarum TaxID=129788 RepID=UPI00295AB5A7|nr:baculoviral IAP repeat-containing protein 3-like isoform X2 [Ruditapes philippinarum]
MGPYNRSENGNIVTTESASGISHSEMWEGICHEKGFGVLRDETANVLSTHLIEHLPANVICLICLQKLRACTFLECRHLLVCQDCQHFFTSCPVCRKKIKSFVPTILELPFRS